MPDADFDESDVDVESPDELDDDLEDLDVLDVVDDVEDILDDEEIEDDEGVEGAVTPGGDDDSDDESDDDEETDEALDELEAEEFELEEDELAEVMLVDEAAELRAIRREELTMNVDAHLARSDEFVCRSCYLVKRMSQLANKRKMYCRDCAS